MIDHINERKYKLEWIGDAPTNQKKAALLIPQYNESSHKDFNERLNYFKNISYEFRDEIDVIIIDDGSSDGSLKLLKHFLCLHPGAFYLASVFPNGNKVGALFLTILSISHEFIILSDFDTDISGLQKLTGRLTMLRKDSSMMGGYFRMVPFEGTGNVFLFQQLEYSLQRCLYKFHEKELSIRVMPGAGSCYKRAVLISIYMYHSGLRSGEDREATLIGLKEGYKALYLKEILALTRPPSSYRSLVRQRVRWNLGYLETFYKEKAYYFGEIKKWSRIGAVTVMDFFSVVTILLFPFVCIFISIVSIVYLPLFLICLYLLHIGWCLNLLANLPEETREFKDKRLYSLFVYPVIKLFVDYFGWMGAIISFCRKLNTYRRTFFVGSNKRLSKVGNTIEREKQTI